MRGSCLCGDMVFEVDRPLRDIILCHCMRCRKTSGHIWAATSVPHDRFRLIRSASLTWFASSDQARRGFCKVCGSSLFWEKLAEARISIGAGTLDGATGLAIDSHWHTDTAGDYYQLPPVTLAQQ